MLPLLLLQAVSITSNSKKAPVMMSRVRNFASPVGKSLFSRTNALPQVVGEARQRLDDVTGDGLPPLARLLACLKVRDVVSSAQVKRRLGVGAAGTCAEERPLVDAQCIDRTELRHGAAYSHKLGS